MEHRELLFRVLSGSELRYPPDWWFCGLCHELVLRGSCPKCGKSQTESSLFEYAERSHRYLENEFTDLYFEIAKKRTMLRLRLAEEELERLRCIDSARRLLCAFGRGAKSYRARRLVIG